MDANLNEIISTMSDLAKQFDACRSTFIALGDENRQHIVIELLENFGGLRVNDIAKRVHLSRPAVSHHLKILKEAGIIDMFKRGTKNYYHMNANMKCWGEVSNLATNVETLVTRINDSRIINTLCNNENGGDK